jgi:hypothetical protein
MPQIRLQFTLDSLLNVFGYYQTAVPAISIPSSFTITNFEVCYELYHAPAHVMSSLIQSNQKLYLKSISFNNVGTLVPSGTSGALSLNFNVRYNSIKAGFLYFAPTASSITFTNGQFDSYDLTQNSGDYQLFIGGISCPQKPLSAVSNRSGILSELRKASTCFGAEYSCIFDKGNEMDIATGEFNALLHTTASTQSLAQKFFVGFHTEKLHNNTTCFSGISSQNTAIVARITCPTATAAAFNAQLITIFDALIEMDLSTGQVNVKT